MQSRTKNVLTIHFSSDAKVNSFLNTIRDGENPFSFKKILQLSDDPKVNESRSELLAYATIKRFGTDPRNYKPDGLAEMMKNYFHPYWFANEHLKQEEVEQGFQALSDRKGMLSVAEPNKNEMVDAGFRNGSGKGRCRWRTLCTYRVQYEGTYTVSYHGGSEFSVLKRDAVCKICEQRHCGVRRPLDAPQMRLLPLQGRALHGRLWLAGLRSGRGGLQNVGIYFVRLCVGRRDEREIPGFLAQT